MEPLRLLHTIEDDPGVLYWCPGCRCAHRLDQRWKMTGTPERPTFEGSVLVHGPMEGDGAKPAVRCHSFVTDGQIRFLADCGHALAGKTVPMEPF